MVGPTLAVFLTFSGTPSTSRVCRDGSASGAARETTAHSDRPEDGVAFDAPSAVYQWYPQSNPITLIPGRAASNLENMMIFMTASGTFVLIFVQRPTGASGLWILWRAGRNWIRCQNTKQCPASILLGPSYGASPFNMLG